MDVLPLVFSSGWASGVNSYLVVLVLGIVGRVTGSNDIPDVLTRGDVLLVAGGLFLFEFVADKIPYVDSTWDAVSTAIRPTIGAIVGVLLAGDVSNLDQAVSAVVGGTTALASHTIKAGTRLAVNTSPEPVTNSIVSVLEDVTVIGVVLLAIAFPWIALAVCVVLLIAGSILLVLAIKLVRRGLARWKARRARTAGAGPPYPGQ